MVEFLLWLVYLASFAFWVYTLVRQAKKKKWVWFVFSLLFPIVALFYWLYKGLKTK